LPEIAINHVHKNVRVHKLASGIKLELELELDWPMQSGLEFENGRLCWLLYYDSSGGAIEKLGLSINFGLQDLIAAISYKSHLAR